MHSFKTPLARVKGLGSAHAGSGHWLKQRISAVIVALLFLWFAFSFASLLGSPYRVVHHWISQPFNTTLLIVLCLAGLYHALLGMEVIIEDYCKCACQRLWLKGAVLFFTLTVAIAMVVAILRVAMGG